MRVGVLTSSRADFGIYLPLIKALAAHPKFDLQIIAFGMHLQVNQGFTYNEIVKEGFDVIHKVGSMPLNDSVNEITEGYGELIKDFSKHWVSNQYDLVLALGDRWEMSAAVQSTIPFEIRLAHIHGGETTLGAIDNIYRHQISLAATYHFTAAQPFANRVIELIGTHERVYNVGSISLEELDNIKLPPWNKVMKAYDIPFRAFVLVTFHPETVGYRSNVEYAETAYKCLKWLAHDYNILITKANSDTLGSLFNHKFKQLEEDLPEKVRLVSSLGKLNYFSALQSCEFMLGNTSSGIIESASFGKWVINVGNRQKGRLKNTNVFDAPFELDAIMQCLNHIKDREAYQGPNLYVKENTVQQIINTIIEDEGL